MRIYAPKTKSDFSKASNFMSKIIEKEFGYKINNNWHWDILNLQKTYSNTRCMILVLENENKIIATISGREYDREYDMFKAKYNSNNTLGIWRHYVEKEYRGKGIGTKLLFKLIKFAKLNKYKYLYLHTQKTIPNSLEYWVAKGFKIIWDTNDEYKTVHLIKMIK